MKPFKDTDGTRKSFVKPWDLTGAAIGVGEQMGRGRGVCAAAYFKESVQGDGEMQAYFQ